MAVITNQTTVACTPEERANMTHLREAVERNASNLPDRCDQ